MKNRCQREIELREKLTSVRARVELRARHEGRTLRAHSLIVTDANAAAASPPTNDAHCHHSGSSDATVAPEANLLPFKRPQSLQETPLATFINQIEFHPRTKTQRTRVELTQPEDIFFAFFTAGNAN